MKKHLLNAVLGIIFASLFLFLTLRNKPLDEIFLLLREARTGWIIASIFFLGIILYVRSLRWQLFLSNIGEHAPLKHVAYSILLGTFLNSFTPKIGEIVRCTSLEKSTGIKSSKALGTTISDRVWDLVVLLGGVIIVLIIESEKLGSLVSDSLGTVFSSFGNSLNRTLLILGAIIILIFGLLLLARKYGWGDRIRKFWRGTYESARMTFRIKRSGTFALLTILIWMLMVMMNYACLKALPSTDSLSFYFAVVALFIGTLGWAIPSPAGIGTSHFFVLQLFILYGLNEEAGVAYGILINGVQVVITVVSGSLAVGSVYIYRLFKPLPAIKTEQ